MLHDHDDQQIRLVADGLTRVLGKPGAAAELTRLYGHDRVAQALAGAAASAGDVVIDIRDAASRTIDLRDAEVPTRPSAAALPSARALPVAARPRNARGAAAVYGQAPARRLVSAGPTRWL